MISRLLFAGFLMAHAAIHLGFVSSRPRATAGGPAWPFELGHSWILPRLGLDPGLSRVLGIALVAVTFGGFALAALAALGLAPPGILPAAVAIGAASSIGVLALFFHPWLVLGVGIDLALMWAVLVAKWVPSA